MNGSAKGSQARGRANFQILALVLAFLATGVAHAAGTLINSKPLREAVTVEAIREHLEAFQAIADQNGGNRFAGSPGHLATVDYAEELLSAAGYTIQRQEYSFPFFQQINPPELEILSPISVEYLAGTDILTTVFSGSGEVTAEVVPIDVQVPATGVSMTSGCELTDFQVNGFSIVTDKIALIQRGTCAFLVKVQNAVAAGAIGVVLFNQGTPGRTAVLDASTTMPVSIPVIGASYGVGEDIVELNREGQTVILRMKTDTVSQVINSVNLLADTTTGDPNQTLVLMSSLSGPLNTPGINTPGTGAATMLELAMQLPSVAEPRKRVRFAFLDGVQGQGAGAYMRGISQAEWESQAGILGVDALGSSNFVRFVVDGDNSSGLNVTPPPNGSGLMESALLEGFQSAGLATAPVSGSLVSLTTFSIFRQPFKPIAGLSTGVLAPKTTLEAEVFGGTAGLPYDTFFEINDLSGVNFEVLGQMKDALAHGLYVLVRSKTAISDGSSLKPGKRDYALPNEGICEDDLAMCSAEAN